MPHLNIKVKHSSFKTIQTKIYLYPQTVNNQANDYLYLQNSKKHNNKLALGYQIVRPINNIYKFNVTNSSKNKFRRY